MKRLADLVIALPLLVVSLPFVVVLALATRLETPGPLIHRARRVGKDGRIFTMYKLRTMVPGAGPAIARADDPRVTRLGAFLRRTRLDELPQLWNVVAGDMSLVGPRPEDARFVALYDTEQRRVLELRPGMTGPAQLVFHDEARLLDPADPEGSYLRTVMPRKLAIDLEYSRRHTLAGDLAIILRTVAGRRRR